MKMRRLFLAGILLALLVTGRAAGASFGTCGEDLQWTLDGNGHLSITGTGEMTDWTDRRSSPWGISVTSVTIGPGVTRIGSYAFYRCDVLKEVRIPSTVRSLGSCSFAKCESLPEIVIPNGVETIEYGVFIDCFSLKEISLPESVLSVRPEAFSTNWNNDPVMQNIHVDERNPRYREIDGVLFERDSGVLVRFPDGRKGPYAVPEGVTRIGRLAFLHCSLQEVTLPEGVTAIGRGAFQECCDMERISLPESLTEIGDQAFYGTGMEWITLPRSVQSIGDWALGDGSCENVVFLGKPEKIGPSLFGRARQRIHAYYSSGDGWKDSELADYGGTVLWIDYSRDPSVLPTQIPAPTHTPAPETVDAAVRIVWNDGNDREGRRPKTLKAALSSGVQVILSGENGWSAAVADLPKYAYGNEIRYTWTLPGPRRRSDRTGASSSYPCRTAEKPIT